MAAHYDIFRHHLVMKFPAYGHALWEPDPGNLYPAVQVGDVGYIREGKFHRLFNVLLPAEDESHADFGVPEYHEPLTLNIRNHINIGKLRPNNFCSAKVTSMPVSKYMAEGPDEIPKVTFYCPRKEGAVLSLPIQAKAENTVASADFGKWMIRHIDNWFAWARQLGLDVDRMEDIVLVTGTHCTRSCTNVAFPGGQDDAQISFGAKVDHSDDGVSINWQFSHEQNRGVVLNYGPEGKDLPEDQCVFIRGFRATRKLKILPPRLKGAAGPNPDPEGDNEEPDAELMPIPALPEYRDPLHVLLEYIAEEVPDCDMVLVHDDDLARLDGIFDVTRPDSDVTLSHIRNLKPTLHNAQIDLSSARNSASADTESAWVATLSNVFENRSPGSTSSAPRSFHVGMPLPREERRARPRLFSVSASSLFVFILVLFFLLPLPPLPFLPTLPSSSSSSFFSSSFSISSSSPSSLFEYFLAALFISFSFFYSFYFSFSLDFSLWLVGRSRALVQASLRGLEYLENLGRWLFVEAWSGPSSDANLGREVRKEDAEEQTEIENSSITS